MEYFHPGTRPWAHVVSVRALQFLQIRVVVHSLCLRHATTCSVSVLPAFAIVLCMDFRTVPRSPVRSQSPPWSAWSPPVLRVLDPDALASNSRAHAGRGADLTDASPKVFSGHEHSFEFEVGTRRSRGGVDLKPRCIHPLPLREISESLVRPQPVRLACLPEASTGVSPSRRYEPCDSNMMWCHWQMKVSQ